MIARVPTPEAIGLRSASTISIPDKAGARRRRSPGREGREQNTATINRATANQTRGAVPPFPNKFQGNQYDHRYTRNRY